MVPGSAKLPLALDVTGLFFERSFLNNGSGGGMGV